MKKSLFAKLISSVRQMNQIVRRAAEPSREFVVQTIRTRKIRDDAGYDAAVRVLNCMLDHDASQSPDGPPGFFDPFIKSLGELVLQYASEHPGTRYRHMVRMGVPERTIEIIQSAMGKDMK